MSKNISVTIGIPVFNEQANIKYLLNDILNQKISTFYIDKIIIYSDGCTDNTLSILKSFNLKNMIIIENHTRLGQSYGQNRIIEVSKSDILVLLNGDILIKDKLFLDKLIQPIQKKYADLTSSSLKLLKSKSFIEEILSDGMQMKYQIYENYNTGRNVYTCHGAARAFSKRMYKNFKFISSIGEDAYSYFYTIQHKFKYSYVKKAIAYIKYADNLNDHKKQSLRFHQSKIILSKLFGCNFIKSEYDIPKYICISTIFNYFMKKPIQISIYILILIKSKLDSYLPHDIKETWDISLSSKTIHQQYVK